jgi:hypothetical protein
MDFAAREKGRQTGGVKRRLVVDAAGCPLGATIVGAHVHATKLRATTLDAVVVDRP